MDSVTIGIRDGRVALINNTTRAGLSLTWQAADAVAAGMEYKARGLIAAEAEHCGNVSVRRDGESIVVVTDVGQTVLICPLAAAIEIAHAMKAHARKLEEFANAEALATDQAILQRSGKPFGLTRNPRIQAEAGQRAAWSTDLRRYIRSSSKLRQQQVGTPGLGPLSALYRKLLGGWHGSGPAS